MGSSIVASIRGVCATFMFENCVIGIGQVYTTLASHFTLMKLITKDNHNTRCWTILQNLVVQGLQMLLHETIRQIWRWRNMDCNYTNYKLVSISRRHLDLFSLMGLDVRSQ
jgi:hypothetical protein